MTREGFRKGLGVFACEGCGKNTRGVSSMNTRLCRVCLEDSEHENVHLDGFGGECLVLNCKYALVNCK